MACTSTSTIKKFDNNSFPRFHGGYAHTERFGNYESEIMITSNNQFLCSRTRYNESIGSGYIVIEKGQFILRNNNCEIMPAFKELKCYIVIEGGDFRDGFTKTMMVRCKNEKGTEYKFRAMGK